MSPEKSKQLPYTMEQRQKFMSRPSWETVFGILDIKTSNSIDNLENNNLLHENRALLKDYYEAVIGSFRGSYKRMRRFKREYEPDKKPTYDPSLEYHMGIIRSVVLEPKIRKFH